MWGRFMYGEIRKPDHIEFENWPLEVFNILTLSEWEEMTTLILKGYPINAIDKELDTFIDGFSSVQQGFAGTFVYIITRT